MLTQEAATKIIRRLAAAEGYLELNLPDHALVELDRVEDAGPYSAISNLLRGEALKAQDRFSDAIVPLREAAEAFPAPLSERAWRSLSDCYRRAGDVEMADQAEHTADACVPPVAEYEIHITPQVTFKVEIKPTNGKPNKPR